MNVIEETDELRKLAALLLARVKKERGEISVAEARQVASKVRETEGWLQSIRSALRSEGGL